MPPTAGWAAATFSAMPETSPSNQVTQARARAMSIAASGADPTAAWSSSLTAALARSASPAHTRARMRQPWARPTEHGLAADWLDGRQ